MKEYRFHPKIKLDTASLVPLCLQIREQLKKCLMQNRVKPGTRLVSERQLSEELGINRNTIHQAYQELLQENIFECKTAQGGVRVGKGAETLYQIAFPTVNLLLPFTFSYLLQRGHKASLQYVAGILDHATEKGISVNILSLPPPETEEEKIKEYLDGILSRSIGIISMGCRFRKEDPVFEALLQCKSVPHVFVTGYSPLPHISSVNADIRGAVCKALRHLQEQKIRKIGIIAFADKTNTFFIYTSRYRMDIVEKMAHKGKMQTKKYELDGANKKEIALFVKNLISEKDFPKAFFVYNDESAVLFADELKKHSFRIPEDIQLIGYDDSAPEKYQLSTMDHNREEIGKLAVDMILELYEKGKCGDALHKTVPAKFIQRKSSSKENTPTE